MLCLLDERLNILKLAKKQEKTKNKTLKQTGLQDDTLRAKTKEHFGI